MKKGALYSILLVLLLGGDSFAQGPAAFSKFIRIDQFGYLPDSRKVAVIADPQTGFNAAESFNPGTAAGQYQVRNWTNNSVAFTGTLTAWNNGATHAQSGDKGWWFDFSALTTPGSYYIYDLSNNVGSYRFEIGNTVYKDVLRQAMRMYFYQRVNFAKQPPYTDAKWADAAAYGGANQDYAARSRWNKTSAATAKDLHGGWYDAGDCNKYTTFTFIPICNLLESYRRHPTLFTDDYNIPESGNGIPDVLDEVKYELDWLIRMQDGTGTNGLFLKLGADNYNGVSPPSADPNPRYYVPECTSATLTGAANFAFASIIYKSLGNGAMTTFGNDLLTRAVNAWNRALVTTGRFTTFETSCDDQNIVSGDADADVDAQRELAVTAAVYLFEATGNTAYRAAFDTLYTYARPVSYYWWGPYYQPVQRALLRYTQLPGATQSVINNIRTVKGNQNGVMSITDYNNKTDLYRAFMPDDQYTWGSNETKASAALDNFDFAYYSVNPSQAALYKEVGASYVHWFHGVNPMGKVMLSNMYAFGGDSCINEFYHGWFGNGTQWDNVFTSLYGPPPGYVPGGPNKNFSIQSISPPGQQPPQKSFREWNTGWNGTANENSWEITEPGIYTQSAYISLLVRTMAMTTSVALPVNQILLTGTREELASNLRWKVEWPDDVDFFEVERSIDGNDFIPVKTVRPVKNTRVYTTDDTIRMPVCFYRIRMTSRSGEYLYSSTLKLSSGKPPAGLLLFPNPSSDRITIQHYAETETPVSYRIASITGREVASEKWIQPAGHFSRNISVAILAGGAYWLEFTMNGKTERRKFFKV